LIPFQKERKEEDPSLNLQDFNIKSSSQDLNHSLSSSEHAARISTVDLDSRNWSWDI
jgi:hypothetical protein